MKTKCRTITHDQCRSYLENGYLFTEDFMSEDEIDSLSREAERVKRIDSPGRVMESNTGVVRALNGSHLDSELFDRLTKLDCFVSIAKRLLEEEVYLYQFKVNFKEAFDGEIWEWHQGFPFWHFEDGMPLANAVNIGIFLDDVTEFNGPLVVLPGSHKSGLIGSEEDGPSDDRENWESDFSAKLKFALRRDVVQSLEEKNGMVAPKGKRGSVLIFHPNIVHGSGPNISPKGRKLLVLTYNSVRNAPDSASIWRPEFLVSRDARPLHSVGESLLSE